MFLAGDFECGTALENSLFFKHKPSIINHQKEIKLNEFQLSVLLSDEEKNGYRYLLNNGVYCNGCQSICKKGVEIKSGKLNFLNRKENSGCEFSHISFMLPVRLKK